VRRRTFLRAAAGAAVVTVAAGAKPPEHFLFRRARFFDHGRYVSVSVAFPELLRASDRDAMAWLDSGFETVLRYRFLVLEHGTRREVARATHTVTIRYDFLRGDTYEVRARTDRRTLFRRNYATRAEAIAAATKLVQWPVVDTRRLVRGGPHGPAYVVAIVAQRNPLDPTSEGPAADPSVARAQPRDVQWFGRLVGFLVGEIPEAEVTVRVRTQPFYLEAR